jgi:hypothetical protein
MSNRSAISKVAARANLCFAVYATVFAFLLSGAFSQSVSQTRYFYAIEDVSTGTVVRRDETTKDGIPANQLILAPNTVYREWLLQSNPQLIGSVDFKTPAPGYSFVVPKILLGLPAGPDSDHDGLTDDAEFVLGTNPLKADTDGDGIPDGVEIAQGTDPLDGLTARTGIVGATGTPGPAVDVSAFNDIVAVADSQGGVSVFNVFNRMVPILITQVKTPGLARAVACSGNFIAVANDTNGLAVIDVSDPPNSRISQQIDVGGSAQAVAAAGDTAYLGLASGDVLMIDMTGGYVLDRVAVGGAVQDLVIAGGQLYVLTDTTFQAIQLGSGGLQLGGSVSAAGVVPNPRRRLFVGGGLAYAVHARGYNLIGLTNPNQPQFLKDVISAQLGWKQLVANGTGIGIAMVGQNRSDDGPHDVSMYNLNPAGTNTQFITTFVTPGIATAVTLYNGFAYVADASSGLEAINYLQYDTSNSPPSITLSTPFLLTSPTNATAEEGKIVTVSANVSDDVQVRNVEFYIDGQKSATDGNFPFEYTFRIPWRTPSKTSFGLRARASDTGGNFRFTDEIRVDLSPDVTPPGVRVGLPSTNSVPTNVTTVIVYFDSAIDPATLTPDTFKVISAGADNLFGTADDLVISNGVISYRDTTPSAMMTFPTNLAYGLYRGVVSGVADKAGNVMTAPFSWLFATLAGGDNGDPDNDDLTNVQEMRRGTNPLIADTDGDGWPDGVEVADGKDPLDPKSRPSTLLIATPKFSVVFPSLDNVGRAGGLGGAATTLALPPVRVVSPGLTEFGTNNTLTRASPPVGVFFPSFGTVGTSGAATTLALPPLRVVSPGLTEFGTNNTVFLASPPTRVVFPFVENLGGLFLAKPAASFQTSTNR